jgi:hypothetical protein
VVGFGSVVRAVQAHVGAWEGIEIAAEKVIRGPVGIDALVVGVDTHGSLFDRQDAPMDATLTDLHELRIRPC